MKYHKILSDLLKAAETGNGIQSYRHGTTPDGQSFICTGYWLIIIPEELNCIDYEKITKSTPLSQDFTRSILDDYEFFDAIDTNTIITRDKLKIHVFRLDDGTEIGVNEKYYKLFDGCNFRGKERTKPLIAYDPLGNIAGVIMPVKID